MAVFVAAGLWYTSKNLRFTRKNLDHLDKTNKENNVIQAQYVLQARLIELSHEWNSKEFITARNWADLIISECREKAVEVRENLSSRKGMDQWIYISMVAHFFLRLSRIQLSHQIHLQNARLEFGEAIGYWLQPLLFAYGTQADEKRLRKALIDLHNTYYPESPVDIEEADTRSV
ncbi:hypothetical protein LAC81_26770 [Ensifer adhaerens]|uniref:hypothetical protein n=1 Tax=Ensifer adhaerens TaxID=106592 RepID=UPI001CC0DB68|nr:hypothetical protein [Ensifer adhaerens]MBZ7924333.1 hypothetical protein [Ensifer adhaerens]UAX96418.1 hypothetical protein LAC78_21715 [Ensifer adhaerens]UAY04239.1 hypothetical protein LAC80_23245 [Ensifer adhaerens]UAY12225.1 hypothetical protein LAC81_26770 [Ensifer adhaerens]